jgi:hypothetical protein
LVWVAEPGAAGTAALVRPRGYLVGGVEVPVGKTLSGPKLNVTASL